MRRLGVIFRILAEGLDIGKIIVLRPNFRLHVFPSGALVVLLLAALAGCGGSKKTATTTNTISVSPTTLSLNLGDVAAISASVVDANGATVSNPPVLTYASSNTAIANVSTGGLVCAGKWDTNFIVCDTTGVQPGTANITVTSGSLTATVPIFTHTHVDRVTISPANVNCVSSTQTQQLTAKAFSNGLDITPSVGPFTWTSLSIDVATVDSNGLVTGKTPGSTGILASVTAVNSQAAAWVTCPVQSINIHLASGPGTTFSLAAAGNTVNLAADVLDSHSIAVSVPLTWNSTRPAVANVNGAALVTAVAAGSTTVSASCASNCNIGLASEYSNAVVGTVAGTSASTVYVTGIATTSLVPVDTGTNAAGTAITLPFMPNSLLFNPSGTTAYLGSSSGLMAVDTTANTVTQNTGAPGTVLAISPDNNRVIVASATTVSVLGVGSGITTEAASIASATAADFTPDSRGAYIVAGNTLYFWTPGAFRPVALSGVASGVKFLPNGPFGYLVGGAATNAVTARATCDNSLADTILTPGAPTLLAPLPDASAVLAVDSPGIDVISVNTSRAGCPPPLSDTLASVNFGAGTFTARQLIVLPDGSKAFMTSDQGKLLGLTTATSTPFTVPLVGGANAFTGATTLDGTKLYVGGSDNAVHRIDVASNTDAQQIGVSFKPDLVAVRPK